MSGDSNGNAGVKKDLPRPLLIQFFCHILFRLPDLYRSPGKNADLKIFPNAFNSYTTVLKEVVGKKNHESSCDNSGRYCE